MALIFCPECGNQVSEKAEQCNKCSYPINKINVQGNENVTPQVKTEISVDKIILKKAATNIIIFLSLLLVRLFLFSLKDKGFISPQNKQLNIAITALYLFPPILLGYAIKQITGNIIGIILAIIFIILTIYLYYDSILQLMTGIQQTIK